jgi:CBS domain-containing protein
MPLRVSEIMNAELFDVKKDEPADLALQAILTLGITGAPVLDEHGKPLGLVSLRDLVGPRPGATAGERMTQPAATVPAYARIGTAARRLARTGYHRLVVVDGSGRAVGMVSAVDVVRGLLGLPAPHPASFPHLDRATGLSWTDEVPLDADHIPAAPEGSGVIVLLHGGPGEPECPVWAESSDHVRRRLQEMLTAAQPDRLAAWLEYGGTRFRATSAPEPDQRAEALAEALRQVAAAPPALRPEPVAG